MRNQSNTTKRIALYARVSMLDKCQDLETQLVQLRGYAQARNFDVVSEFIDYASGTSKDRTQVATKEKCEFHHDFHRIF